MVLWSIKELITLSNSMVAGKFMLNYNEFRIYESLKSYIYEIFRYHSCDRCNTPAVSDTRERDAKKLADLETLGKVIVKKECEWRKERADKFSEPSSKFSVFYYDEQITMEKIIEAIKFDEFFGFLNLTMTATEKVRKKFGSVNFPPVFKKIQPEKSDLSPNMSEFFKSDPTSQLTVGYDVKEMTLASNLVKFYLQEGYVVEDVHWALSYQRGKFPIYVNRND